MSIGNRIKERRRALNLTQKQLADRLGIRPSAIANYENDISSPKESILYKLFEVLDCDPNYLFQDNFNRKTNLDNIDLKTSERNIIKKYRSVNDEGQEKINDYVDDIYTSPKYKKHGEPEVLLTKEEA